MTTPAPETENQHAEHIEPVAGDEADAPEDDEAPEGEEQDVQDDDEHEDPHFMKRKFLHLLGPGYARKRSFWVSIGYSSIPQGLFLGCVALGFYNFFEVLSEKTWLTHEYEEALAETPSFVEPGWEEGEDPIHMLRCGNGEWWYVGLLTGAGACVGLTKVIWTLVVRNHPFPAKPPGFIQELAELRSEDPWIAIPVLICSGFSIGLGASLGPEAGMGCAGSAFGCGVVANHWKNVRNFVFRNESQEQPDETTPDETTAEGTSSKSLRQREKERQFEMVAPYLFPDLSNEESLCALDGIAAAFGALFPSQYLSGMLIHELGSLWEGKAQHYHFMMTVIRTGVASSCAYALFVGLQDLTFLDQATIPTAVFNLLPKINVRHMLDASILGFFCGLLGLLGLLSIAICDVAGTKLTAWFDSLGAKLCLPPRFLGMLMTPVVGGVLIGLMCVGCPLILSDGAVQLGSVVVLGRDLGAGDLMAIMFAKLASVSISSGFGFVGGTIFPLIFMGACLGAAVDIWIPDVELVVSATSCMAAVPCAFIPALFTLTTVISMVLALGGAATTPVFCACICSYTTVAGAGVIQDAIAKAMADPSEVAEKHAEDMAEEEEDTPLPVADSLQFHAQKKTGQGSGKYFNQASC